MRDTTIGWTDDTWNVSDGCSRVSEGCRNCFAERIAARFSGPGMPYEGVIDAHGRWNNRVRLRPERLLEPTRWREPRKIFVNSMSDLFHEGLTFDQIAAVFGVMAACSRHTFQVLTKRPERRFEFFQWIDKRAELIAPADRSNQWWCVLACFDALHRQLGSALEIRDDGKLIEHGKLSWSLEGVKVGGLRWPLPNVWQGTSVEDQAAADERIPWLMKTAAAVRFLSIEPMLGPVDLLPYFDPVGACDCPPGESHCVGGCTKHADWRGADDGIDPDLHWVIIGCESGRGMRPCAGSYIENLIEQCEDAHVPVFLKQAHPFTWVCGEKPPHYRNDEIGDSLITLGKGSRRKAGGVIELPYFNGKQYAQFPMVSHG